MSHARAEAAHAAGGEVAEPVPQPAAEPRHASHIGPAALEEAIYWARQAATAAREAERWEADEDDGVAERQRERDCQARVRTFSAVSMAHSSLARAAATAAILVQAGKCSEDEAISWDMITGRPS